MSHTQTFEKKKQVFNGVINYKSDHVGFSRESFINTRGLRYSSKQKIPECNLYYRVWIEDSSAQCLL